MEKFTIKNLAEFEKFTKEFLEKIYKIKTESGDRPVVISLVGDLGVGKTTFVQILARELGIKEVVNSPTYIILKQYQIEDNKNFKQLVHMDAYRLDSLKELEPLRFNEYLNQSDTVMCIEWADKIKEKLPADIINVSIRIVNEETREIIVG